MPTETVHIIDPGGGGDYTTLTAWEAAQQRDITAATGDDTIARAKCRAGASSDNLDIDGWTTNRASGNIIRITADAGHEHGGLASAGFRITSISGGTIFTRFDTNVEGIVIIPNANYAINGASPFPRVIGCVIPGTATDTEAIVACSIAVNNIIYGFSHGGAGRGILDGEVAYNNTVVGCRIGIRNTETIVNNISTGNATDYAGSGGTVNLTNLDTSDGVVFADAGNSDYHLDSTDTAARGNGTDLSADGTFAFDYDIDGDTRSAWDIGADEFVAAAGAVLAQTKYRFHHNDGSFL